MSFGKVAFNFWVVGQCAVVITAACVLKPMELYDILYPEFYLCFCFHLNLHWIVFALTYCIEFILHWVYIALSLYCIELYIHILHWIYIALNCIHIILHWIVHRNCIELYTNIELNYIQILHWVEYIEFNRIQILHWIVYKYCIELYTYCIELSHIALNCHILHWVVTFCIEL